MEPRFALHVDQGDPCHCRYRLDAGLLYLPRLFVYHADVPKGSEQSELFKIMEKRLLTVIMNPAMIIAWVLGLCSRGTVLAFMVAAACETGCRCSLVAFHGYLGRSVRDFSQDLSTKPARHWRMVNEIPTVLMVIIVVMVIVKPF